MTSVSMHLRSLCRRNYLEFVVRERHFRICGVRKFCGHGEGDGQRRGSSQGGLTDGAYGSRSLKAALPPPTTVTP